MENFFQYWTTCAYEQVTVVIISFCPSQRKIHTKVACDTDMEKVLNCKAQSEDATQLPTLSAQIQEY